MAAGERLGSPLCIASGWQSGGVCVLVLSHDVPGPADGVGHHEVVHQLGVAVGYSAGAQDTLAAGVRSADRQGTQSSDHNVVYPAPQDLCQRLVLLLLLFTGLNESLPPVHQGDGDIYHRDMLAVFVGHNDVHAQLALVTWNGQT